VSELEYEIRKQNKVENSLCKSPFTGFYIGPTGHIVLCCMSQEIHLAHINDVDDLELFYNDSVMEKYRKGLLLGAYSTMKPCTTCHYMEVQQLQPFKVSMDKWKFKNFDDDWNARLNNETRPIRYLEYTLSNICNADCATCKSEWSSKWQEIDRKFGREVTPLQKVADKHIVKIEKILYGLEYLMIKGGEPFADIRNIRILKKLTEVNPSCKINIISNFHAITPEAMDILANLNNVHFTASIDAVTPETYEWIRGGNIEKTIANMKNVYKLTGNKISVSVTVSLYNYFLLDQIKDFFKDTEYVSDVKFSSFAPEYDHTVGLLPASMYNKQKDKLTKAFANHDNSDYEITGTLAIGVDYDKIKIPPHARILELEEKEKWMKDKFFHTLDKMNKHRGFDLCDYVPELKEWRINT
jgi:MoaA/NifB/PqqE/SkfB family radical SAM enzyme